MCPGVGPEGWLRWFAHRLGGVVCRGHVQYPAFALGSSKVAVGFFGLSVSFVQNLPQLGVHVVIFSPIQFLCYFVARGEVCRGASTATLQQRVPGPSLSQNQYMAVENNTRTLQIKVCYLIHGTNLVLTNELASKLQE